jgi:hypothetical protein
MHKFIMAVVFIFVTSQAQFSASFRVNVPVPPPPPIPPPGYVILPSEDENMNRPDLMVISPTQVGFWVQMPSGRYVLHCRAMRYDRDLGEWYYGPWHEDYNLNYNRYRHSSFYNMPFNNYMQQRYPKYYDKRFRHHEDQENRQWREEKRKDDKPEWKEEKRHDDRRDQDDNRKKHDKDDREHR